LLFETDWHQLSLLNPAGRILAEEDLVEAVKLFIERLFFSGEKLEFLFLLLREVCLIWRIEASVLFLRFTVGHGGFFLVAAAATTVENVLLMFALNHMRAGSRLLSTEVLVIAW